MYDVVLASIVTFEPGLTFFNVFLMAALFKNDNSSANLIVKSFVSFNC